LVYLGLFEKEKAKLERTPPFPQTVETIIEPHDDGWLGCVEPLIDVQTAKVKCLAEA